MFKNYNLTDEEVLNIISEYESIINKASIINGIINDDLKEEIVITIYLKLTKNRKK